MLHSDKILGLISTPLKNAQLYLVDLSIDKKNNIKIILDSDDEVRLVDCISISRAIEKNLDRENEDFSLEVTSAGLGQPLKQERQYKKYLGKEIEVLENVGLKHQGKLISLDGNSIQILKSSLKKNRQIKNNTEENVLSILFSEIKQTKAIIKI